MSAPDLVTLRDVMTRLKTGRKPVLRLIATGDLRGLRVGRQWRFDPRDVDAFIARQQVAARPAAAAPVLDIPRRVSRRNGEVSWKGAKHYYQ